MERGTRGVIGFLTIILLLSGVVYVQLSDTAKMRVDEDKATFYIKNDNNRWEVSGREHIKMFDGSTLLYRDVSGIRQNTTINNRTGIVTVQRHTPYKRGPVVVDTWRYQSKQNDVRQFPTEHTIQVHNGTGYIFQYSVRELDYDGETIKNSDSPVEFGNNMKVEWNPDESYWNTVYKSGIVKVKYRPKKALEEYHVRLYDPPPLNGSYVVDGNKVYVNSPTHHIEASPKNISSGRNTVYVNATSKIFAEQMYFVLGFDGSGPLPVPSAYKIREKTVDVQLHSYICEDPYTSTYNGTHYWCLVGDKNNSVLYQGDYHYFTNYSTYNSTANVTKIQFIWNITTRSDWKVLSKTSDVIHELYDGKETWNRFSPPLNFSLGKPVEFSFDLDVPSIQFGKEKQTWDSKYNICFYPSRYEKDMGSAIISGEFYCLDPWTQGTTGVQFYWSFDPPSNNSNVFDLNTFVNCTVTGAVNTSTAIIGAAMDFELDDGDDHLDCVSAGTPADGQFALSIAYWLRPEETIEATLPRQIIMDPNTTSDAVDAIITGNHLDCTNERISITDNGARGTCFVAGNFPAGRYDHHAFVWNSTSSQYNFFINGTKRATVAAGPGHSQRLLIEDPIIGLRNFGGGTLPLDGVLDEFGIWNRSLTGEEVDLLFNNGAGFQFPFAVANSVPVLEAFSVTPDPALLVSNLSFNITCSDVDVSDALNGSVQLYNGSSLFGPVHTQNVSNNTNTLLFTLNSSLTNLGEVWTGEFFCADNTTESAKQNASVTVQDIFNLTILDPTNSSVFIVSSIGDTVTINFTFEKNNVNLTEDVVTTNVTIDGVIAPIISSTLFTGSEDVPEISANNILGYTFDDVDTDGQTIIDVVDDFNATNNSAVPTVGIINQGYLFNTSFGINITIEDVVPNFLAFSIWFKPNQSFTNLTGSTGLFGPTEFGRRLNTSMFLGDWTGTIDGEIVSFTEDLNRDAWAWGHQQGLVSINNTQFHHFCIYQTVDNASAILVLDGVDLGLGTPSGSTSVPNWTKIGGKQLALGQTGNPLSPATNTEGVIDEFTVFNTTFNDTDCLTLYNGGAGIQPIFGSAGSVGHWQVNVTAPTLPDGLKNLLLEANLTTSSTLANDTQVESINYQLLTPIFWEQNVSNQTANHNGTPFIFVIDFNATNSSIQCQVQNYTTNDSRFLIDINTGNLTVPGPNINLTGISVVNVSAADNCTNIIFQIIEFNVTNTAPFCQAPTNISVIIGNNATLNLNCSDPDNDLLTFFDNSTDFNISSNGTVSFNVTFTGQRDYLLTASDTNINTSVAWSVTGLSPANLTIQGLFKNTSAELGSPVQINATALGQTICIDVIEHPSGGVNLTCASDKTGILFNISSFFRDEFNDSSTSQSFIFNGTNNITVFVDAHQYDEVETFQINLTGTTVNGSIPKDVQVFVNGTLSNDLGILTSTPLTTLTVFNDSTSSKALTFNDPGQQLFAHVRLPKNANVSAAFINVTPTGNFTTQEFADSQVLSAARLSLTYFKPNSSTASSTIQVRMGFGATENLSIPAPCFAFNPNRIEIRAEAALRGPPLNPLFEANATIQCNNGTDFQVVKKASCSLSGGEGGADSGVGSRLSDGDYDTFAIWQVNGNAWVGDVTLAKCGVMYEEAIVWQQNPEDAWLEVGFVSGNRDWNQSGVFVGATQKSDNFSLKLAAFLATCTEDDSGFCDVPLYAFSEGGAMLFDNLTITYEADVNPVSLNLDIVSRFLGNSSNFTQVPITITSSDVGNVTIDALVYEFLGGNQTFLVTAHNPDSTTIQKLNLTYYHSRWDFSFPAGTDFLEFIPNTPSSENVSPYSQSDINPIFNITSLAYGNRDFNFSMLMNGTFSCVNLSVANSNFTNNKNLLVNFTWLELQQNVSFLSDFGLWMFADYNCSFSGWRLFNPDLFLRACAVDAVCSEAVT